MEPETFEFEGRTKEEAIKKACEKLNVPEEKLEVEVIERGSSGIFGIVRAKKIRIRVRIKEDGLSVAKKTLEELLKLFPMENFTVEAESSNGKILLQIKGEKAGIIIGKGGRTLDALEFIVNKIVNKKLEKKFRIVVDFEQYRKKKEEYLKKLALSLAERAKKTKKPALTIPLTAKERRIIHLALKEDRMLETKTIGEGDLKKVMIIPKSAKRKKADEARK